jgi:hypothetical protein
MSTTLLLDKETFEEVLSILGVLKSCPLLLPVTVGKAKNKECYHIYLDKCTLVQLINSYQSHAKCGDDGTLSGYSPLLMFPPCRTQLSITPSINPFFIGGHQAAQFKLKLLNMFSKIYIFI